MGVSAVERGPDPDSNTAPHSSYAQQDHQYQYGSRQYQYPPRPRTASRERSNYSGRPPYPSPSPSPTASRPPVSYQPNSFTSDDSADSYQQRSYRPPRSSSREPPRSHAVTYVGNIASRPSEASRLRALESSYRSASPDGHYSESFSRPRTATNSRRNESPHSHLQSSHTFPVTSHDEAFNRSGQSSSGRARGISNSSAQSNLTTNTVTTMNASTVPLRPSASIPDYNTVDRNYYPRQRNMANMTYRVGRANYDRPNSNNSIQRRDPVPPGNLDDEVRSSFRSALTTGSSYLDASGTERSSVVTKSSSATSITGRDEGMSVDDAIGMYESGFADSEIEDEFDEEKRNPGFEPRTHSELGKFNNTVEMNGADGTSDNYDLGRVKGEDDNHGSAGAGLFPPTHVVARDSAAIFRPHTSPEPTTRPTNLRQLPPSRLQNEPDSSAIIDRPKTQPEPTFPDESRDRYGFKKKSQYISIETYDEWNGPYTEYLERRKRKWASLMKEAGLSTNYPDQFPTKSNKVKRFVRKGIPPEWRGQAWWWYAGGPSLLAKHLGLYRQLTERSERGGVNPTDEEIIERDLNRTFPDNLKFKPDVPNQDPVHMSNNPGPETETLKSLRRVLRAFSIYNPKIGYCQSLNFLAGLLLLFMDEERSFWMLNIITRVYLPGTHEVNLEGANVDLGVLMMSIKDSMPAVWAKIGGELDGTSGDGKVSMQLPPITLCTTAWFMSCFIGTLPIESTLRVWDSFFYEGSKTLFRIALTVFKVGEPEIKAVNDPMEIFQVVQTIPRKLIDANALLDACFKRRGGFGGLSQATIEARRAERRAGYAAERAMANGQLPMSRKKTLRFRRGAKKPDIDV